MKTAMVYMTAGSMDEAKRIASVLVEERLAACVNILPGMESVYRWQGKVETAREAVMIAKTREELVSRLVARVKELHSYEVPCIVVLPIEGGSKDFLDWIVQETRQD